MGLALAPETRASLDCRAVWRNALERQGQGWALPREIAPSDDERMAIRKRIRELGEALAPCRNAEEVGQRLTRFLPKFGGGGARDPIGMISAYTKDLVAYPLWALEAACLQVVAEGKREFAPSSPALVGIIQSLLTPLRIEHSELVRVADAALIEPPSPEDRERTAERIAELATKATTVIRSHEKPMGPGDPPASQWGVQYAADRLEKLRERAQEPVTLSDEARAMAGMAPRETSMAAE